MAMAGRRKPTRPRIHIMRTPIIISTGHADCTERMLVLEQRNASLRRCLFFAAFALAVTFAALISIADWKVTVVAWLILVAAMPRFAKR